MVIYIPCFHVKLLIDNLLYIFMLH
jgi:hypothetical protein